MKKTLVIFATLLLAACVSLKPMSVGTHDMPWPKRQIQLQAIHSWHINAVMGIHKPGESDIVSASWDQQGDQYIVRLSGPLNSGSARIEGSLNKVTLWKNKQPISAASPEQLIKQVLGWQLPISNLRYWILGLPVPALASQQHFDAYHHLSCLKQQGWHIRYANFVEINNIDLPTKIWLDNSQIHIKIVIRRWKVD